MSSLTRRFTVALLCLGLIPLCVVALMRIAFDIPISNMMRDVANFADLHPLLGFVSTLGILLWWTSTSIYLFTSRVIARSNDHIEVGFLRHAGLISMFFALDDQFQIHEYLGPRHLKVPEWAVMGLLAAMIGSWLWRYRRVIDLRASGSALLVAAFAFLGLSVVTDLFLDKYLWRLGEWGTYFIEDGAKWLGACCWTAYGVHRCADALTQHVQPGAIQRA